MSDLVMRIRFPAGAYNAGGGAGTSSAQVGLRAEWPPAPERVLAAGLAGQAGTGSRAVEVLYELDPPLVVAPPVEVDRAHVQRNGGYVRWVPSQTERLDMSYTKKAAKVGDNTGVLVSPEHSVFLVWPGAAERVDVVALDRAYRRVAYLGRPTSPAVIDVSSAPNGFEAPENSGQVYVPTEGGPVRLSVGTPAVLQARNIAHALQVSVGRTNIPNLPIARSFARYRIHELTPTVTDAGRRAAYDLTRSATWYPAAATWPMSAVPHLVAAARRCGASWAIPVIDDGRVLGLLADVDQDVPEAQTGLLAVVADRVVRARASTRISPIAIDVLRAYVSTSTTWTTDLPVAPQPDLADAVRSLSCDALAVHAVRHDEPLGRYTVMPPPGSHNVTVIFDEPVTGPLFLAGAPMLPTRSPDPTPGQES